MANSEWIDPTIFSIGGIQVRWYGLMYVLGYLLGARVLVHLCQRKFVNMDKKQIDSFITHLIIGMFLGARLAYVFIYNWAHYRNHLDEIFSVWKGGLSFHGAVAGMCLATYVFCRKHKLRWFQVADGLSISGAPGLFFGRMGNFINGELYGRVTESPLGMVFPGGGPYKRHPSQLYEGVLEGIVLFAILYFLHRKVKIHGYISAVFLAGYGVFRFCVEFFREPDSQLGYYFGGVLTMGQILCLIMILLSGVLCLLAKKQNIKVNRPAS